MAADVQTGSRRRADGSSVVAPNGGKRQGETRRAAFVDGQVLDAGLVNGVGNGGAGSFHQGPVTDHDIYGAADSADLQLHG